MYSHQKNNYALKVDKTKMLSLLVNFLQSYFGFCVCGRLQRISYFYNSFTEYASEYTDVLGIANNIREVGKLKYLIFDKDQVNLFNMTKNIKQNNQLTVKSNGIPNNKEGVYKFSVFLFQQKLKW